MKNYQRKILFGNLKIDSITAASLRGIFCLIC